MHTCMYARVRADTHTHTHTPVECTISFIHSREIVLLTEIIIRKYDPYH